MKFLSLSLLIALSLLIGACAKQAERFDVAFYTDQGELLADGIIEFGIPFASQGDARGSYSLKIHHIQSPGKQSSWFYKLMELKPKGALFWQYQSEEPEDYRLSLDFAPGVRDANITVSMPTLLDGKASGSWSYSIYAGGYHGGRFTIQHQ